MENGKLVRFMPNCEEFSKFAGWEGTAVPAEPGYYRVAWRNPRSDMPEIVGENHLSFRIRKFSKRFA